MPPAKKPAASRTTTRKPAARKPAAAPKPPAALGRLTKSLDAAQEALGALGSDVGSGVSTTARGLYRDLQKAVKNAQSNSTKLGRTLEKDLRDAQKKVSAAARPAAKKPAARKPAARKPAARRTTAKKS